MYYYNTYYCYILSATRLFIIIIVSLIVQCPIMFSLNVIGVCNKHSKRMLQKMQYVYSLYIVEDGIQSKEQWLDNRKIIILLYIGTSLLQSPLGQSKSQLRCVFFQTTQTFWHHFTHKSFELVVVLVVVLRVVPRLPRIVHLLVPLVVDYSFLFGNYIK